MPVATSACQHFVVHKSHRTSTTSQILLTFNELASAASHPAEHHTIDDAVKIYCSQ